MHVQDDILKKRVLWGTVTWSKMGQQNIHAKKGLFSSLCEKNCSLQMLVTLPAAMDGKPTIMVGKQPTAIAAIIVLIISTSALKGNVG